MNDFCILLIYIYLDICGCRVYFRVFGIFNRFTSYRWSNDTNWANNEWDIWDLYGFDHSELISNLFKNLMPYPFLFH